jgi:hypothetical protein
MRAFVLSCFVSYGKLMVGFGAGNNADLKISHAGEFLLEAY